MKFVSFLRPDGRASFARLEGDTLHDLGFADPAAADLKSAIASGKLADLAGANTFTLADVSLLPVVPNPGKIFCVGVNYDAHRRETGRDKVAHPTIFTRFADTLNAHGAAILRPKVSTQLDFEGELAVIIGKPGRAIREADAANHIAGYACFNDVSVRDWQRHTQQFTPGKNFPTTGPFGPQLVTPDEAGDLSDVHVITRLNGEVVQNQPISDLIFPIPRVIAYISTFTPLNPGDVIATGTPGGVGARRDPPLWMQPGDRVEVEIGPMGRLANTIAQEA